MKFIKPLGLVLTVIGLFLYSPPLQEVLNRLLGESGSVTGAVVFASGWVLLFGYLAFNLGKQSYEKKQSK